MAACDKGRDGWGEFFYISGDFDLLVVRVFPIRGDEHGVWMK